MENSAGGFVPGVITFFSSHDAVRCETVLKRLGYAAKIVPGPKDISPNCGVAVRFDYSLVESVKRDLETSRVRYENIWLREVDLGEKGGGFWQRLRSRKK